MLNITRTPPQIKGAVQCYLNEFTSQVTFRFHALALFLVSKKEEGGVQPAERETEAEVRVQILKADWVQKFSVTLFVPVLQCRTGHTFEKNKKVSLKSLLHF